MLQRIPDRVDPWRLAEQEETLEGRMKVGSLPRLSPLLADANGEAAFVLTFAKDRQHRLIIALKVDADLTIECQRCLGPMVKTISSSTRFARVRGLMEAEQLPKDLDPLVLEDGQYLVIAELVEDELILGIPTSPRHDDQHCNRQLDAQAQPLPETEPKEINPFAILASLQTDKNDN